MNTQKKGFFVFPALMFFAVAFACFCVSNINVIGAESSDANQTQTAPQPTTKQAAQTPESEQKPKQTQSFLDIILAGGVIGLIIILLSIVALALVIEHFISIRASVLIPPSFADEVVKRLAVGKWSEAAQLCETNPSILASIIGAGINERELGWDSVEKTVEDTTAEHAARLYRKTEYLSLIGNIAPMLGLLGTVVGMIVAFRDLSDTGAYNRAGDLAQGIYLALVTTVEGLIVAIPALSASAILNNRIAFLVAEMTYIADQVLRPLKKALILRKNVVVNPTGERATK
ncbi:MAG: MotA/TolQ/ExbB proton channel family protein [Thermoguttaceae bacterium]